MLDLEVVVEPTEDGLDIVSLTEIKKHVRISITNTDFDDQLIGAVREAADMLGGVGGILNRTIFPTIYRRYLSAFPSGNILRLPYPPLISVSSVGYNPDESPTPFVSSSDYIVRKENLMIPEIEITADVTWPTPDDHPRAVWVEYRAGYLKYPEKLKRLIKILAAHYFENPEATINEPRQMMVNRAVAFGHDALVTALRIPVTYDNWED